MNHNFSELPESVLIDTGKMQNILDRVHSRFPERIESVNELFRTSRTFREICTDYHDISAILDRNCPSERSFPEVCRHARELSGELEEEILRALKAVPTS